VHADENISPATDVHYLAEQDKLRKFVKQIAAFAKWSTLHSLAKENTGFT
jgi:hypothetical protein